jgi:hypothetical protein
MFAQQRENWPLLRDGITALGQAKSRVLEYEGAQVVLQANPGRRASTHAKVDAKTIARRPCFLCPENFPTEERGIAFGELVILPNPFPVLPKHCTIPDRKHTPQRLAGRISTMLELARAIGPDMLVFYNGPRCGASAPDHFHFQACDAASIPLLGELPALEDSSVCTTHHSFGRCMLVFSDRHAERMQGQIHQAVDAWRQQSGATGTAADAEPMLNLLALFRDGRHICVLFPRVAHRPACYFADGPNKIAISPATLEMAGLLVVAEPDHFDRVDATIARQIFEEVSAAETRCAQLMEAIR